MMYVGSNQATLRTKKYAVKFQLLNKYVKLLYRIILHIFIKISIQWTNKEN